MRLTVRLSSEITSLLAVCAAGLLVAACGSDDSTVNASSPSVATTVAIGTSATELAGHTFSSTEVTGTVIPGGGPLVLTFPDAGRVSLTAGCNRHVGAITIEGDTMTFRQLASTRMACPPPKDGADAWVAQFTGSPVRWTRHDTRLVLSQGSQRVTLVEVPPTSVPETH